MALLLVRGDAGTALKQGKRQAILRVWRRTNEARHDLTILHLRRRGVQLSNARAAEGKMKLRSSRSSAPEGEEQPRGRDEAFRKACSSVCVMIHGGRMQRRQRPGRWA